MAMWCAKAFFQPTTLAVTVTCAHLRRTAEADVF
jgi:hypothetical protein